ncbi:hypothetical protein A3C26_02655 [Candidatus Daviesbacteria bacterium RIFCSPHIGHO2_02_FULL_39_12]|uniref:Large ribosomal subunit protein bL25 n=2 Tax=Candidatus Daviesiibacteriota TaxID=1752718 RepID=A0A1F5J8F0_9BACT|nr:MAG: hypothetical protein A3C26_02655 [Candidatus Daviesbacteria bacterium RIFCSPHIGHO2_02_FULL_39_12]OGE72548.1 MAG: hypothetical protein A3H40_00405 [Candidatus Daviesbacteria bacterium RIFCSPLOWO2_02_FULL_38_15]
MDKLSLDAKERIILGKKVKRLRKDGLLPGHVFGKKVETEHVTVSARDFLKTFHQAGETGLISLKIGEEKVRPVMVRGVQYDPVTDKPIHIDFYQVNLTQKVKVPVPLVLTGEQPESVNLGEAIVLQTLNELEVEALPTDLVERIEADITLLKNIGDAITVGQLNYDKSKLTIQTREDEIVVRLAPAVSEEMKKMMEEEAAAAAAVAETQAAEGGVPTSAEATAGKLAERAEVKEGEEAPKAGEAMPEAGGAGEKPAENTKQPQGT